MTAALVCVLATITATAAGAAVADAKGEAAIQQTPTANDYGRRDYGRRDHGRSRQPAAVDREERGVRRHPPAHEPLAQHPRHYPHRDRDLQHGSGRGVYGSTRDRRGVDPLLDVDVAPETEHWRSNYVPDDYRQPGYDGRPDRATVCRGASGATYSTRAQPCPPGQKTATDGESWSTR